jgi:hypothetical protein
MPPGELDPKEYAVARRLSVIAILACALSLTACFPPGLRGAEQSPAPLDLPPIEFTGELEPGACLQLEFQLRPDRDSVVPCTESHRYDVVVVREWPELGTALEQYGADPLWYSLATTTPTDEVGLSYRAWAERSCSEAFLDLIGWRRVMVDGVASEFLSLRPGGPFDLDVSLASREEFVGGDRSTICSVAWDTPIAFPEGVSIERLTTSGMPDEARECYTFPDDSEWANFADCVDPHDSQTILWFDVRAALGDELISPIEQYSDDDYATLGRYCEKLIDAAFHGGDPAFYGWGEPDYRWGWVLDDDGGALEGERYLAACSVVRSDGRQFSGDAFDAVARRGEDAGI